MANTITMGEKSMNEFTPIKNEKTVISIRIDRDMLAIIDTQANETDISRNEMIIQCIEYALKNSKTRTGKDNS